MTDALLNLNRFIEDYTLRQVNGTVRFDASLVFLVNGRQIIKYSEVHIITSDKLSAVYFLNAEISNSKLPDVFDLKKNPAIYIVNECLQLEKENIQVSIYPGNDK